MRKIYAFALLSLVLLSCDKDEGGEDVICTGQAVVRWGGDPAADGLGWYISDVAGSTDSTGFPRVFIPRNLPDYLKIDGQPVQVCLYKTDELFFCHCPAPLNKYEITMIKKR